MKTTVSMEEAGLTKIGTLYNMHVEPRVLLVEDSPESEGVFRAVCRGIDRNLKLKWVKTAEEARALLKKDPHYDLIIADHFLEGTSTGLDLWRMCQEEFEHIPVMITSALELREFLSLFDEEESSPLFLSKPFHKKECQKMIEWHLGKNDGAVSQPSPIKFHGYLTTLVLFMLMALPPQAGTLKKALPGLDDSAKKFSTFLLSKEEKFKDVGAPQGYPPHYEIDVD